MTTLSEVLAELKKRGTVLASKPFSLIGQSTATYDYGLEDDDVSDLFATTPTTPVEEENTTMKAKEALRQVIELSDFRGDPKDYEGFIEYVKNDNEIAAKHVRFVTAVLDNVQPIKHHYGR